MKEVSIEELYAAADEAREDIWDAAKAYGRDPKIYLHWSAGHYFQKFSDYHINITADGKIYLTTNLSVKLPHTYMRNSGAVGISLCCAAGADTHDLGDEPPTTEQIEAMAQAIVAVTQGLWLTINKEHVMTHGEAADNEDGNYLHENYGPRSTCERWDLEYLGTDESPSFNPYAEDGSRGGDVLRGKALWYLNEKK